MGPIDKTAESCVTGQEPRACSIFITKFRYRYIADVIIKVLLVLVTLGKLVIITFD